MGKVDQYRFARVEVRPEAIEGDEVAAEYTDQAKGLCDSYIPYGVMVPPGEEGGETRDGTNGKESQMEVPGQV